MVIIDEPDSSNLRDLVFSSRSWVPAGERDQASAQALRRDSQGSRKWVLRTTLKKLHLTRDLEDVAYVSSRQSEDGS